MMKTKTQTHTRGPIDSSRLDCDCDFPLIAGSESALVWDKCALHAAAPELLEAAKAALLLIRIFGENHGCAASPNEASTRNLNLMNNLRAAIAKATGEGK